MLLPHRVAVKQLRVHFGRSAELRGWLGTGNGDAIGGQPVRIETAPADGSGQFVQTAVVRTGSNGVWRTELRPGPSRIVRAVYAGSSKFEPSASKTARVVVPADLRIHVQPNNVHWGGTITISGELRGGHIPPAGEVVFLSVGWRGGSAEIGNVYAGANGRFSSTYTFHHGVGTQTYALSASSGREADYPYAPGRSNRVAVTVSP